MKLAELFVQITGEPRALYSTLDQVRAKLMGFGNMRIPLGGMFAGLAGTAGLVGVGAAMKGMVSEAMTLEKAYSQIRKTTGLTGDEMEQLKTKLITLSTTMSGVKLEEVHEIAAMAGRLGIQGVDGISEFTKSIAMIRISLDDIPAEEAATRISRILNVFKLGPSAALDFASALNKLDDTSTATGRDILNIASRMSGTAATLGLSPQKLLALAATLKDAGVESEIAASAIDRTFMLMASHGDNFAKVAGVSAKEFAEAFKGDALNALKMFLSGLSGLDKSSQMQALEGLKLHGTEASGALLQLNQVIGKLDGNVAVANSEWKSHASILAEVDIQGKNTTAQLDLLWNNVKLTAGGLGTLLLPVLKDAAAGFGEMATSIRENFGAIQTTVTPVIRDMRDAIETAMVVFRNFGDVVSLVGLDVAEGLEYTAASVEHVATSFKAMVGYITDNVGGLANVIFESLTHPLENVKAAITGLIEIVQKFLSGDFDLTADDLLKTLSPQVNAALAALPEPEMPAFRFDASGYDAERARIRDLIAARERARLDDNAKKPVDLAPGKDAPKQEGGTNKLPGQVAVKFFMGGAADFAKHLQEGIFGKGDDAKKTAENTGRIVTLQEEANRLQAGGKPGPEGGERGGGMAPVGAPVPPPGPFRVPAPAGPVGPSARQRLAAENDGRGMPQFGGSESDAKKILAARRKQENKEWAEGEVRNDVKWANSPDRNAERDRREVAGNIDLPTDPAERKRIAGLGVGGDGRVVEGLGKIAALLEQANRLAKGQKPAAGMAVGPP